MVDQVMKTPGTTGDRVREYLESGKRFDERNLLDFRDIVIEKGISNKAEGSVRVKVGATEVLVGVKMDVGTPYPDSADKGNLIVTAELLPLSSPRFENGPPKFPAIEVGRLIDRYIRESKFIQMEKLCIKEGEKVWNVYIDIYSINDEGNLLDAAGIGAVAALRSAKMPGYNEETEKADYKHMTTKSLPLEKEMPVTITVHKVGKSFLVDPTREEEDLCDARVTFGIKDGVISSIQKGESSAIDFETMKNVIDMASKSVIELEKKIEKALK
jgi:exosome complex component RRP42